MGIMKNGKQEAADNRRAKQKAHRRGRRDAGEQADFTAVDAIPMLAAIAVAGRSGGAIRLGLTRDGGAYAVGCYQADDYATEYIRPSEHWEQAWDEIVAAWWPERSDEYHALKQWYSTPSSAGT